MRGASRASKVSGPSEESDDSNPDPSMLEEEKEGEETEVSDPPALLNPQEVVQPAAFTSLAQDMARLDVDHPPYPLVQSGAPGPVQRIRGIPKHDTVDPVVLGANPHHQWEIRPDAIYPPGLGEWAVPDAVNPLPQREWMELGAVDQQGEWGVMANPDAIVPPEQDPWGIMVDPDAIIPPERDLQDIMADLDAIVPPEQGLWDIMANPDAINLPVQRESTPVPGTNPPVPPAAERTWTEEELYYLFNYMA